MRGFFRFGPALAAFAGCSAVPASPPSKEAEQVDEGSLLLRAYWEPVAGSKYGLYGSEKLIRCMNAGPAESERRHERVAFEALLPGPERAVGDVWPVDPERFLPFLRQFHPGATVQLHAYRHPGRPFPDAESNSRRGAEGAFGCLLARSGTREDVLFRVHAELVLAPDEVFLTPAQFEARFVCDRSAREVLHFSMRLPARDSNFDLVAKLPGREHRSADIGFVPRMDLKGGDEPPADGGGPDRLRLEDARERLRRAFYDFAKIRWSPFPTALDRAREEARPIHVVVLFGALDDESC